MVSLSNQNESANFRRPWCPDAIGAVVQLVYAVYWAGFILRFQGLASA